MLNFKDLVLVGGFRMGTNSELVDLGLGLQFKKHNVHGGSWGWDWSISLILIKPKKNQTRNLKLAPDCNSQNLEFTHVLKRKTLKSKVLTLNFKRIGDYKDKTRPEPRKHNSPKHTIPSLNNTCSHPNLTYLWVLHPPPYIRNPKLQTLNRRL